MITEKNCPTHLTLVECYLDTHFKDISCAIFFDPLGDGSRIETMIKLLDCSNKDTTYLVCGDIYIYQMQVDKLYNFVNNLNEDQYGYVAAWNGSEFITENT